MPITRSNAAVARAAVLARAQAARAAVAALRAAGAPATVLRTARDEEARCWSAYRAAVRG